MCVSVLRNYMYILMYGFKPMYNTPAQKEERIYTQHSTVHMYEKEG